MINCSLGSLLLLLSSRKKKNKQKQKNNKHIVVQSQLKQFNVTENALPKYKLMNLNSPHLSCSIPIPQSKHTIYLSVLFSDSFRPLKSKMSCPFDNCPWQSLVIITSHATGIELYRENESARWSVVEGSGLECMSTGSCTELHIHTGNHHVHCHKAFCHSCLYLGLCLQASHGVSHVLNFYRWEVWGNIWLSDIYSCVTTKSQILHPVRYN